MTAGEFIGDKTTYANELRIAYATLYNAIMTYGMEWCVEEGLNDRQIHALDRGIAQMPIVQEVTLEKMLAYSIECGNANFRILNRLGVDGRDRRQSVLPAGWPLYDLLVRGMKSTSFGEEVSKASRDILMLGIIPFHDLPAMEHTLEVPSLSENPILPYDAKEFGSEFAQSAMRAYCKFYTSLVTHGQEFSRRVARTPLVKSEIRSLIALAPHPQHIQIADILEMSDLVRARNYEWFYRLGVDGRDLEETIESATYDLMNLSRLHEGKTSIEKLEQSSGTRVWDILSRGGHHLLAKSTSERLYG